LEKNRKQPSASHRATSLAASHSAMADAEAAAEEAPF